MKNKITLLMMLMSLSIIAQNKFAQLDQELPDPNTYRTASGQAGKDYWQQKADYKISMTLDDENTIMYGEETITYTNNSPDQLSYLWLQLDQNVRAKDSDTHKIRTNSINDKMSTTGLKYIENDFDGGFKIDYVKDVTNKDLRYTIVKTMMRVELPNPINTNESYSFKIKWQYNINNTNEIGGRSGYEPFEEDGNNVYCIAQFYPRMCVYNDIEGWQNKQFLGRGEFTVGFGDFEVDINVPSDHLVASTGLLQNQNEVLSKDQIKRLNKAHNEYEQPIVIATKEEADERIKTKAKSTKTWKFKAENVRDFGFATSRRFIWDAMNTKLDNGKTAMAMSMYIKEGDCLWSKYSTKAVAHTLKWFSHYTVSYPYPVAWSIDGSMGMEYPMICFNYGRCEDDNTYSARTKYGHIGVIIHEVGHNFFPMIINSDERQWTWMDEGLTTFVQYLTEQQWERNYPSRRGPANLITDYMGGDKSQISPIMTNSESIFQFGNNAYFKPATALNILRETILGRELFDYALKEYSRRWAFKQPYPADFFRTMEDASGVDLDWFWRGWFYTTEHVDLAINEVKHFKIDPLDPSKKYEIAKDTKKTSPKNISIIRNEEQIEKTYNEIDPTINDFYTTYDPDKPTYVDNESYEKSISDFDEKENSLLASEKNYYEISFENKGGLPMPIILQFEYVDGTNEVIRIPAEIWRYDATTISKVFPTDKEVKDIILDPFLETADVDTENNYFPKRKQPSRFEIFKDKERERKNPMQIDNEEKKRASKS
jgi:hypothetical protein